MINHPNRARKAKPAVAMSPGPDPEVHNHDRDYSDLLSVVRSHFCEEIVKCEAVFQTDVAGLRDLYLRSLPGERQIHNCNACLRFIDRFGGLVRITEDGTTVPLMWNEQDAPEFYRPMLKRLRNKVAGAYVTNVFYSKDRAWGQAVTGEWRHIAVTPPANMVFKERALTAEQAMAAKLEDFKTVTNALDCFKPAALDQALTMLRLGTLARAEKFIGPVEWLRKLHDLPRLRTAGYNQLWLAVATAPAGYCHPRSSVVGPLLEGLEAGLAPSDLKRKFDAMLDPLAYQRPQAAPSSGNIAAAEQLFIKLGLQPSLDRRFARLEECVKIWEPKKPTAPKVKGKIFGHLDPKQGPAQSRPSMALPTVMTWAKFAAQILPSAEQIQLEVPMRGAFIGLTTAVNAKAPPLLKWDYEEERNPVAWYVYASGSEASVWNLKATWTKVNAVVPFPTLWGSRPAPYLGEGVVLILDGARDSRIASGSNGNVLFPEMMRGDLLPVRSTIEAYSKTARLHGYDKASACGYDVRKHDSGRVAVCKLRVMMAGVWATVTIDRWD